MKKKIKVTKFMENGAEIIANGACGALFIKAGIDAGILPYTTFLPTTLAAEINDFSFASIGAGMIGGLVGHFIARQYINELKKKEDSIFEFEEPKLKKNKI